MPAASSPAPRTTDLDAADCKARFERDGFATSGRILGTLELAMLADRVDAICDGRSAVPAENVRYHDQATLPSAPIAPRDLVWQVLNAHCSDEIIAATCRHHRVLGLATLLLGRPCEVVTSQIITKPAGHGAPLPWHQDSSYWGSREVVTCWLAIDDATAENGCMRMIPGSHLSGQLAFTPRRIEGIPQNLLETDRVDASTQVHVRVMAGCASFHSPRTLHASDKNTSSRRRRAIAITYGSP